MGARLTRRAGPTDEAAAMGELRAGGLQPHGWGNRPGDSYEWHQHGYAKVLFCVAGGITFHTDEGDIDLVAGDRLELDPHTRHAATVGPQGVRCVEAARAGGPD